MSEKPRRRGCCLAGCLAALGLVVLLAVLALAFVPSWIVSSRLRTELEERGIACDDRLSASVSFVLDEVTLAPVRCTLSEGRVEAFELAEPVTVGLESFEPVAIDAPRVIVTLRETPDAETAVDAGNAWMRALGITDRLAALAHGSAALAREPIPRTTVGTMEVLRSGAPAATLRDVAVGGAVPVPVHVGSVDLPVLEGPFASNARVTLRDMDGTAARDTIHLEGDLEVDASVPLFGAQRRTTRLSLDAAGLDGPRPTWTMTAAP